MADKKTLNSAADITTALGIVGKTVSSVSAYHYGSIELIDILCTDTKHYCIKASQGRIELGGSEAWGSGTEIGGR